MSPIFLQLFVPEELNCVLWSARGRPETAEILLTLIMTNHWKQLGYKVYSTKEAAKGKKKKQNTWIFALVTEAKFASLQRPVWQTLLV